MPLRSFLLLLLIVAPLCAQEPPDPPAQEWTLRYRVPRGNRLVYRGMEERTNEMAREGRTGLSVTRGLRELVLIGRGPDPEGRDRLVAQSVYDRVAPVRVEENGTPIGEEDLRRIGEGFPPKRTIVRTYMQDGLGREFPPPAPPSFRAALHDLMSNIEILPELPVHPEDEWQRHVSAGPLAAVATYRIVGIEEQGGVPTMHIRGSLEAGFTYNDPAAPQLGPILSDLWFDPAGGRIVAFRAEAAYFQESQDERERPIQQKVGLRWELQLAENAVLEGDALDAFLRQGEALDAITRHIDGEELDLVRRDLERFQGTYPDSSFRDGIQDTLAELRRVHPLLGLAGPAPDVTKWIGAAPPAWDDLRGKVVLIDFWATWCLPCKQSIPHLKRLSRQFAAEGFAVLGLTTYDRFQDEDAVRTFVREHGIPYSIGVDRQTATLQAYGVQSLPQAVLLGRDGTVRWKGDPSAIEVVEANVRRLLEEE